MKKYKTIDEFINDLDASKRKQVTVLRKIILTIAPTVVEHIKWNAPSYIYNGEDRITFNLHGDDIKVILHMGATKPEDKTSDPVMADPAGLIAWNSDIRGTISFSNLDGIIYKQDGFKDALLRWLAIDV